MTHESAHETTSESGLGYPTAVVEDGATVGPGTKIRFGRQRFRPSWAQLAPLLLVAVAVVFSAVLLRAELTQVQYPNDSAMHESMTRWAQRRIDAGKSPFDGWYGYLGLGTPHFHQYQSLPHIFTAYLSTLFGNGVFRWLEYLLMCTWPITVYAGARIFGLSRWQAAGAALLSPMLINVTGYGFEWGSYMWRGSGMWSMLFALWLLPLAWGLTWRAVANGRGYALAAFVLGLTCASHFLTGYLALLSLGVFVLLRPPEILKRLGRAALVGFGGLLIFSFVFVPTLVDNRYVTQDSFTRGTFWQDSYGPGKVLSSLFRGEVFDHGRLPIVSLLVAVGVGVCIARFLRDEWARAFLGLFVLSLLLYFGRDVVGFVVNRLPGGEDLFLHRYISGVHLAGIMLAGVGAAWLFARVVALARLARSIRRRPAVAVAIAAMLAVVVMYPVLVERKDYADTNADWISAQRFADQTDGRDVAALIEIAKQRGDGRIYAGMTNNWGRQEYQVYSVPVYHELLAHDADAIGFLLRVGALTSDIEAYFDERNPAQYDLLNVRYVLTPQGRRPAVPATFMAQKGRHVLWRVGTTGYFEVVDTIEPVTADRSNIAAQFRSYINSPQVAQLRHPLVDFDGNGTPVPSASSSSPYAGPPGSVDWANVALDDGRFTAQVEASRPAWVMLKASYHPRLSASVDGKPVKPAMLAPSFVGVPVGAGAHVVVFQYEPISYYPMLFAIGALTLLGLGAGPLLWKRRRRPPSEAPGSHTPALRSEVMNPGPQAQPTNIPPQEARCSTVS